MTDPITLKLGWLFEAVDANRDGNIDWADYQRLLDRLAVGYKPDKRDRRFQALRATYQMYWYELLRHAGSTSSLLAKEEFVAANRMASMDTSRFNLVEGIPQAVFDVMDANDCKILGREELVRLLKLLEVTTSPETVDQFTGIGNDGNGYITREDCVRSARQFFYTPSISAPGGIFFGMA
ncbi:EF-hand domain-containing protein [Streptomyces noursei]|uniref:EF-hand domain-containing protein n=1 Tax=Streptomyces noursei TaxID=1971 RepID=UPI00081CB077|nr:EF hand repeat-containing protein [Streptomyces noursei ATCC 11455]ANZ21835.1 EF hand repeat-containing protein [Streptomyces noursei ATCC 11455]MCZ0991908.1 EF-hand domain-containing protein [Streptomyces noursei]